MTPTHRTSSPQSTPAKRRGFTLAELLVAMALVVFLMLGVTLIFKTTADAVGAGQAISNISRDMQTLQRTMAQDFREAATDSPFLMIYSSAYVPTINNGDAHFGNWFSLADRQSTPSSGGPWDFDATADGTFAYTIAPALYSARNGRIDQIRFFTRGSYQRRTADDGQYVNATRAGESYVWWGQLNQATTGQLSQYSSERVLGRVQILMRESNNGALNWLPRNAALPMSPFTTDSLDNGNTRRTDESRWDLALTSIEQVKSDVAAEITRQATNQPSGSNNVAWWYNRLNIRFTGVGRVSRPMTSAQAAQSVPYITGGVTQFMVEYAGDFLTQNPNTAENIAYGPDGQVDFVIINGQRQIRWYGYPRDTNGDGRVNAPNWTPFTPGNPEPDPYSSAAARPATAGPSVPPAMEFDNAPDVVPLRDHLWIMRTRGIANVPGSAPFEVGGAMNAGSGRPVGSYTTGALLNSRPAQGMAPYICVWRSTPGSTTGALPKYIRILVKIDDPDRRLPDGLWGEYVFRVGGGN